MHLQDAVALVTGAGHRLGRAIALGLADAGCHVVVHYGRSAEAAETTAADIQARGREAMTISADLSQPDQIETLFCDTGARFGRLDVLVNSAASFSRAPFEETTIGHWDSALSLNARAPFLCTQHAACLMREVETRPGRDGETSSASIVNIGDMAGVVAWSGYAAHGASKAALLHLTRASARELAPTVRVNAVVPGPILPPSDQDLSEEEWKKKGTRVPLGRVGNPADVADAVVFLSTSEYVTGDVLFVDGGEHLLPGG